ncbi:MAG: hypothetical protein ABIO79_15455 [Ferruginibacter sp.]
MKFFIVILIPILLLFACTEKTKKYIPLTEVDSTAKIDSLFKIEGRNLFKREHAIRNWDTLKYTFQMQDFFKDSTIIGMKGYVIDISKRKEKYIVSFRALTRTLHTTTVVDLLVDSSVFSEYKNTFLNYGDIFYIVFKVTKLNVYTPQLVADAEINEDEETTDAYMSLSFSDKLLKVQGLFINCVTKKDVHYE